VTFRAAPGVMFSGDLLFAGSIGRTDLPGGDYPTIVDSLARVCLTLPDDVQVLPGHGPGTTIGAERASNPFLAGLAPQPPVPPGTASPETPAPGTTPSGVPAAPPGRPGRGRPGL
jgi:hypothetical protein